MTTAAPDADPFLAGVPLVLAHLNEEHVDTMLLIARARGVAGAQATVRAVALTRETLTFAVGDATGAERELVITFSAPVHDLTGIRAEAIALVDAARSVTGETAVTKLEEQAAEMARIRTFVTRVVAVEPLTPRMVQITVGGGDLKTFAPVGADQFVYVLAPPHGRRELTIDQRFTWRAYEAMPPEERPIGAYYTVRRWRPERHEIDLWMVLHDHGDAVEWARRADVGDPVALWGPRTAFEPPADTTAFVLVGDETALPAMAAIMESLPAGTPVCARLEVDTPADAMRLPSMAAVDLRWSYRRGAAPGTTTALVDAVRALSRLEPTTYVWGGGESRTMAEIRTHVRQDLGLDRSRVSLLAYWRAER